MENEWIWKQVEQILRNPSCNSCDFISFITHFTQTCVTTFFSLLVRYYNHGYFYKTLNGSQSVWNDRNFTSFFVHVIILLLMLKLIYYAWRHYDINVCLLHQLFDSHFDPESVEGENQSLYPPSQQTS